jgi:hypothetical protein
VEQGRWGPLDGVFGCIFFVTDARSGSPATQKFHATQMAVWRWRCHVPPAVPRWRPPPGRALGAGAAPFHLHPIGSGKASGPTSHPHQAPHTSTSPRPCKPRRNNTKGTRAAHYGVHLVNLSSKPKIEGAEWVRLSLSSRSTWGRGDCP